MNIRLLSLVFLAQILRIFAAECPRCGNTSVPFPLSTNPACGDIGYTVSCNQGKLELPAVSGSYPIRRIDARARKLVISSLPLAQSSCITLDASENGGLSLNRSQGFNVTSSNTIMLLNCSSSLLRSPLNCSGSSICHRYIDSVSEASACRSSNLCCSFTAGGSSTSYRIRATTNGSACSAYVSVVNMDQTLQPSQWNYGVELEWSVPRESVCGGVGQPCGDKNSTCRLGEPNDGYRCLCNAGFVWDLYRGSCSTVQANCNGTSCLEAPEPDHKVLIAGLSAAGAALVAVVAIGILSVVVIQKRRSKKLKHEASRARELALMMSNAGGKSAKIFSAKEMKRATNGFAQDRLLGSGGFGEVYKGILDDGVVVAIKAAKLGNIKGRDQVINEVCILSQVNHRNLVRIFGCCVDTEEPLVVYEFVSNGTLYDWLHGKNQFLDWRSRLEIALQTAEGLAYLHSAAFPPIYHRDVKSSNILLDEFMDARVSDFGLSRLAEPDITHVSTCAQGTLGYMDPEYYRKYQLTDKSDVYSFGVVLLELVTSQRVIDFSRDQDEVNLAMYVMARTEMGEVMDVVDKELLTSGRRGELVIRQTILAVVKLALNCLRESRTDRPTMKEVAERLSCIIDTYDNAN